jgi:hypothetical protein
MPSAAKARDAVPEVTRSVLVLDPKDDAPSAPTAPRSGHPSAVSVMAAGRRLRVRVGGHAVAFPFLDSEALLDLLETAYILDGWAGVEHLEQELKLVGWAIRDPAGLAEHLDRIWSGLGAPPLHRLLGLQRRGSPLPSPLIPPTTLATRVELWIERLINELRQDLTVADLWLVDTALRAHERARDTLARSVATAIGRIETTAAQLITTRLRHSQEQVETEAIRFFPQIADTGDARLAFLIVKNPRTLAVPSTGPKAHRLKQLRQRISRLEASAQSLLDAEDELKKAKTRREEAASPPSGPEGEVRPPSPAWRLEELDKQIAEVQRKLDTRRAELAVKVGQDVPEFPVLYRFPASELVKAAASNDATVASMVFAKLQATWKAAEHLRQRIRPAGARATSLRARPRVEDDVASSAKNSAWLFPKMIDAALQELPAAGSGQVAEEAGPGSLEYAVASRVLAAIERQRAREQFLETLIAVTEFGLTLALTAVCPPAGFALDVVFSVRDVWSAGETHSARSEEHNCILNPSEALGAEPSSLPLAIAIAGAVLTVVTPPRLPGHALTP